MEKRNFYEVPCAEVLKVQQDSNFASSFGGSAGEGSGIIEPMFFDLDDWR